MKYDPAKHNRRSIRLEGFDYAGEGAYFVTMCVHERHMAFGEIFDGEIQLNRAGEIVREEWLRSAEIRKEVRLDWFVVMPNHFHAVVWLVGADGVRPGVRLGPTPSAPTRSPGSLGSVMAGFKSVVTRRINEIRRTPGAAVWQRNYYERVVRDDDELNRIRQYIIDNPAQWALDRNNPDAPTPTKVGPLSWDET